MTTWDSAATPGMPSGDGAPVSPASLDTLLDVSMPVSIEIGRTEMTVQSLLQIGAGAVLTLERGVGDPVDVYVSDRRFAQGEVVVVGDRLGVRITRLVPAAAQEAA